MEDNIINNISIEPLDQTGYITMACSFYADISRGKYYMFGLALCLLLQPQKNHFLYNQYNIGYILIVCKQLYEHNYYIDCIGN